ncbi:MAG: glycosyltransferase [Clostridiales bacterium]|nr:glycosyltransferase [Clostridiales bacterium]
MESVDHMNEQIGVSIICNAFNHEKYIRDALEGFVSQITSFEYEVLIHDDASTDNTAEIIKEYATKYPDIIKPIYQTTNCYSQGIPISIKFQWPRVRGRYIAICEGDDYWIDPYKLQKQFDALEANPNVDICVHSSVCIDAVTGQELNLCRPSKHNCIIPVQRVIRRGGSFVQTNSIVYRASLISYIPPFRAFLGMDYTLQIHGSLRGGMLYIDDVMSVYRSNVPNSWTQKTRGNPEKYISFKKKMVKMLKMLNEDTKGRYFGVILLVILKERLSLLVFRLRRISR